MDEMLRYLKALVVLQAEALRHVTNAEKPEVLLQRADFKIGEIAQMVGKPYAATAQTISRARRGGRRGAQGLMDGE